MNLGELSSWAQQNKPAVVGIGAAGAVGLGLLARRRAGGDANAAPAAEHASYSAGGQVAAAAGSAGVYDSSAMDLYSALSPELAGIGNTLGKIQEELKKTPPIPVPAPPVAAPAPPRRPAPPAPAPTPPPPAQAPTPAGVWYTVRPGDNLTKIAKAHGLGTNWRPIYDQNRSVIGGNPNLIRPGQNLRIR